MAGFPFLELPSEIRRTIYQHHLPVRRLCLRQLLDPGFKLVTLEGRTIPNLMFVSKQVNKEASEVFYSKAILELAPPAAPSFMFNRSNGSQEDTLDLSMDLENDFAYPPRRKLLKMITNVYIFSDQRDAISAEGYESTLKWLVSNTNVQEIHLSRRLMCRLRKSRVGLQDSAILSRYEDKVSKVVRVYSYAAPSTWEMTRRFESQAILQMQLQVLQVHFFIKAEIPEEPFRLQVEPRLDVRKSDDEERLAKVRKVGELLDRLAAKEPLRSDETIGVNYDNLKTWGGLGRATGAIPPKWLYQLLFVAFPV